MMQDVKYISYKNALYTSLIFQEIIFESNQPNADQNM